MKTWEMLLNVHKLLHRKSTQPEKHLPTNNKHSEPPTYLDTGATSNFCGTEAIIYNKQKTSNPITVELPDTLTITSIV